MLLGFFKDNMTINIFEDAGGFSKHLPYKHCMGQINVTDDAWQNSFFPFTMHKGNLQILHY